MKRSNFSIVARLIVLVGPLTGWMLLAILMGLVGHLCATGITVLGGAALLQALGLGDFPAWGVLAALLALCAVLRGILRYAEQACNHYIAFKLLARIRDKVFRALRRLCPAKLEGRDKGDLISLITSDIELLEVFYAHTISPICIAVLFCAVLAGVLASWHPALALVALGAWGCVGIVAPLAASKASGDRGRVFRKDSGALSTFVLDSLRGLPELLQYGQGPARLAELNARTDALAGEEDALKKTAGLSTAATGAVITVFDFAMLLTAAALCRAGAIGFETAVLASLLLMASFGPVVALANLGSTLQSTFAAGNRVLDLLDEAPQVEEVTGKQKRTEFTGGAAQHVTFAYDGETVLQDVSVALPKGQIIGLTGRSGSGKSTLLKLFMRFWEVQQGRVALSDTAVADWNTADLRSVESFVEQDTHLFHDSIRSNLLLAKPDATQAELEAACKKASVHDFIMGLPQGYDTPVGELGDTLSGGERQRLGLARAFLHDAPLLLLDEPTSNLDSLNEAVILRALREERGERTVVLVSHRASTMQVADTVYSVEHGRVS